MPVNNKGARRFAGGPFFSFLLLLVAWASVPCRAQDLHTVSSPDGHIEFRIFLAQQSNTALFRLAYQVSFHGALLLDTSYLGFDIWEQEPLLGENVGMTGSSVQSAPGYNGFTGRYLQNGSLGRALNVEVRVYNTGLAFRYHLLKSMPMADLFLSQETTEFALAAPVAETASLPYRSEQPGVGWLEITEVPMRGYPTMSLGRSAPTVLVSRLSRELGNSRYVLAGKTPMTGPWRVIAIAQTSETLMAQGLRTLLADKTPQ